MAELKLCRYDNCESAGRPLPVTEFYPARKKSGGLQIWCKQCQKRVAKKWQKDNSERFKVTTTRWRQANVGRKFGLAAGEYDRLLAAQDSKCAICDQPPSGRRLAVDHCHETGKVRQLLCGSCNRGIGMFKHDAGLLLKAVAYLTLHDLR